MRHAEHDLFPRHPALEDDAGRVEQDQTSPQPQHQVSVIASFGLQLARLGRQELLHGAKALRDPAAAAPGPDQPRGAAGRLPAQQLVPVAPCLVHAHHRDPTIRLHPRPTNPSCRPYFLKSVSSATHVHCHRRRVAGLLASRCRHSRINSAGPRRGRRLTHGRVGHAPRRRRGSRRVPFCAGKACSRNSSYAKPRPTGRASMRESPRGGG
jgi:hypothetical protein